MIECESKIAPSNFSLIVNLCNWRFYALLPDHIPTCIPILVHLSDYRPKHHNPADWGRVNWRPSSLAMETRRFGFVKLKTWNSKMIGTPRTVNAILLNMKINQPKLVSKDINWQQTGKISRKIYLAKVKILQKSFRGGLLILTHAVCIVAWQSQCSLFVENTKMCLEYFRQDVTAVQQIPIIPHIYSECIANCLDLPASTYHAQSTLIGVLASGVGSTWVWSCEHKMQSTSTVPAVFISIPVVDLSVATPDVFHSL